MTQTPRDALAYELRLRILERLPAQPERTPMPLPAPLLAWLAVIGLALARLSL